MIGTPLVSCRREELADLTRRIVLHRAGAPLRTLAAPDHERGLRYRPTCPGGTA